MRTFFTFDANGSTTNDGGTLKREYLYSNDVPIVVIQ
jgi:hypothetical protein